MANFPLPKGYQRLGAFPIDDSSIFATLVDLMTYASTNGAAYAGQICSVVTIDEVRVYKINIDKTVSLLGVGEGTTAITQPPGTDDTTIATTAFVQHATKYKHVQQIAASEWIIAHNMAKFPNFIVIDSSGEEVKGSSRYDDINTLTLTFSAEISGVVYLT